MALRGREVLRHLWAWRSVFILFLTPIFLLPLIGVFSSPETKCAYAVILMAVYWITESLPLGVTALLPVVLFPLFEIVSSNEIASQYFNDTNMLFVGGLIMATAIEYWNLHRRVALWVLMAVGAEPRWLMLGMMLATWFLSMWISNTATTAMMIPIAEAVLVQLKDTSKVTKQKVNGDLGNYELKVISGSEGVMVEKTQLSEGSKYQNVKLPSPPDAREKGSEEVDDPAWVNMGKALSLCICYASSAGGIACLTGTGPNLILKGLTDNLYTAHSINNPVTFGSWMAFGLPLSLLMLIISWAWLIFAFFRCRGVCSCCAGDKQDADQAKRIKQVIRKEYASLGPFVCGQVMVVVLFLMLVTLWVTRDLGGVTGWGKLFNPPVKDGAAAILIAVLLFAVPSTFPCLKSYGDPAHPEKLSKQQAADETKRQTIRVGPIEIRPLLTWKVASQKLPWHLFLLMGGGYALSKGCEKSGLSSWVGHQLEFFTEWNKWPILFIICSIASLATEVTSNSAMATLLLPIMSELAMNTGVHPLYYMLPTAMATSFAFMLPVATPPNAIVLAYGRVSIADMVKTGIVMNILAVPCLVAVTGSLGDLLFDFNNIPVEFLKNNLTALASM